MPRKADLLARFEAYVDRSGGPEACHLWTGHMSRPGKPRVGHRSGQNHHPRPRFTLSAGRTINGKKSVGQIQVYAHRFALSLHTGIPLSAVEDREACHRCENPERRCVNGAHMYWGTKEQNRADRDGEKAARDFGAFC